MRAATTTKTASTKHTGDRSSDYSARRAPFGTKTLACLQTHYVFHLTRGLAGIRKLSDRRLELKGLFGTARRLAMHSRRFSPDARRTNLLKACLTSRASLSCLSSIHDRVRCIATVMPLKIAKYRLARAVGDDQSLSHCWCGACARY